MADRIIKGDSGNDVIIQNNDASRKIEVTNSGDVEVTGDVKTITVKATNLKANDGTESLEIADSTGDIGFSGNTNLKIKLPSAGGLYESNGSTEILTESSGAVTLKNTTIDSSIIFPASGTNSPISVAMIADESTTSSNGGTANAFGSYIVRNLDTEIYDPDSIVSLSSNQFTLGAGTYLLNFSAPAYKVNRHQAHIYDVTGSAVLQEGTNEFNGDGNNVQTSSTGSFIHTITSNNVYELRHYVETTRSSNGLGVSSLSSTNRTSLYNYVVIYKLK